jgi:hypothetical protein
VRRNNHGSCEELREEVQEAREELDRQAEAAAEAAQGDNHRRKTTRERAVITAQQYLEEAVAKLSTEELALEMSTKALGDAGKEMQAQELQWKEKHASWADEEARATSQLEIAKKEKEQEARKRLDAGKQASPTAPTPGQTAQQASGSGLEGRPGQAPQQASHAAPASGRAVTLEEAEATLVGRCVTEALVLHHKIKECETRRTKLGEEAARPDAPEDEKRQVTKAWEEANAECWNLQEDARKLDIQHMDQARRLRVAFGADPEQAADTRAARRTEIARMQGLVDQELGRSLWETMAAGEEEAADKELERLQKETTHEIEVQRASLAEQEQELRQQFTESDRLEEEARATSRLMAQRLTVVLANKAEVEATFKTLQEDIATAEAAGRARDAAVRNRYLGSADE